MDMIRHKAICPYLYTVLPAPLRHQTHVFAIIVSFEKRLLTTISPLRYMMGISGDNYSRYSCYILFKANKRLLIKGY